MKKKNKTILIRLEEELYLEYKKLCKNNGFNMSQRFRLFIKSEINNFKNNEL